jgi:hypothetical protein
MKNNIYFHALILSITVIVGCVIPRFLLLGQLPSTDEGSYAYYAKAIYSSLTQWNKLPDSSIINLYPTLLSWIYQFSGNHLLILRLADLVIAVISSYIFCKFIITESGNRIFGLAISLIFLLSMNQPLFIQNGFKNSIYAAYIPLLLAITLEQKNYFNKISINWYLVGSLVILSVLLREAFIVFFIIGIFAIFKCYGGKATIKFIKGGILMFTTFIAFETLFLKRSIFGIYQSYLDMANIFGAYKFNRINWFINNFEIAISNSLICVVLSLLGILSLILFFLKSTKLDRIVMGRSLFWLSVIVVPLYEPLFKIGFPYHYSVCLLGMSGLSALGLRVANKSNNITLSKLVLVSFIPISLIISINNKLLPMSHNWQDSINLIKFIKENEWPEKYTKNSNYLLAASIIKKYTSKGDKISISGFMYALYPLTDLLPPNHNLSNLTTSFILLGYDEEKLASLILKCPPNLIMTTTRTDWPGSTGISAAVQRTKLYSLKETIPNSGGISYGNFGGDIYLINNPSKYSCNSQN